MCGICGIAGARPDSEVDHAVLNAMNDALIHRGPDDAGQWIQGAVGLAARRLSIMDVAHGHQPMVSADGRWALAFNGELYNAPQIRREQEQRGTVFRTQCDTEVVVEAFAAYGKDAITKFNGMYALSIYDTQEDTLYLLRDRLGVKPLFYLEHDDGLYFASELDAVLRSGKCSGRVDSDSVDDYFRYLYVPAPHTIFSDAKKLCPGEMLTYRKGRVSRETYWEPDYAIDDSWTMDSAAERYRELLCDAVKGQMASDVPLGAFLSGGMDSSAVVWAMTHAGMGTPKTFTVGFDDAQADELAFARQAAKAFGTDHTEAILKPDAVSTAETVARRFGEPFADSSTLPTWLVSRMAREHVTVALSGDGGDELFAGYTWAHRTLDVARYRRVPGALRGLVGAGLSLLPHTPGMDKVHRFHRDAALSFEESFRRRQTCFTDEQRASLLNGRHSHRDDYLFSRDDMPPENWMLYQDTRRYLPDDILTKVDRMSMAVSLEARVPLLDHRLVEFAATVPFHLKYNGGESKRLVKHALREVLPASLLRQRKRGFSIPIHRWFREELGDAFRDTVLSPESRCEMWLNRGEVRSMLDSHGAGRTEMGHHLWAVYMFEQWLRYVESIPGFQLRK
jgi:asparagine synthase (glutamine-hydrolysing)